MSELPLFPLSGVLLPFGRMSLQIFEPRYLDLVRDSMKTGSNFGVVWLRSGPEVAVQGAQLELGAYGTEAQIVDWDQLPNGLLGITIEGRQVFDLQQHQTQHDGLLIGEVTYRQPPEQTSMINAWESLAEVLQSLQLHPHVQRMNLQIDEQDAWQVAYSLLQLLPLEESLKYELLGVENIEILMRELDVLLNQISGERGESN